MIVVDVNVVAYLLIGGAYTPLARRTFQKDPRWAAPLLWRSEFRSILSVYLRRKTLQLADAFQLMGLAEQLFRGAEYQVDSEQVLSLAHSSSCSAYDCEYVVLARTLHGHLVTPDEQVLKAFPTTAMSLQVFGEGHRT